MDHIGDSLNSLASGISHWLHDGWCHSYPAGHRRHRVSGPTYSGAKVIGAIWTLDGEGEIFGEEGVTGPETFCRILQRQSPGLPLRSLGGPNG